MPTILGDSGNLVYKCSDCDIILQTRSFILVLSNNYGAVVLHYSKTFFFLSNYSKVLTLKCQSQQKLSAFDDCRNVLETFLTHSVDSDQTAPIGAV